MANPELQLLSYIIRHGVLTEAVAWGLRDDDFKTDEARHTYQHMLMMSRDPRYAGAQPGENYIAELYPHFEMCDDPTMTLEAYCTTLRETALLMELQASSRAMLSSGEPVAARVAAFIERVQRNVLAVGLKPTNLRSAQAFAVQPSAAELREELLIPELSIGPGAPTLIVAPGYTGKTALTQAMMLAVASGQKVWGHLEAKTGRVLHVDGEQGARTTEQRYRQLARGMSVDLSTLSSLDVRYSPPSLVTIEGHGRPTVNEYQWQELVRGYVLVVIDNLAALTQGLQENSSEIRMVLDMLGRVSELTGATIVVLHHTTKPRTQGARGRTTIRGSGAIYEAAAIVLMLERDATLADCVRITNEKARGGLELSATSSLLVTKSCVGKDAYLLTATAEAPGRNATPSRNEHRQRVLDALAAAGGSMSSREQLRKAVRIGAGPLKILLAELEREGLIKVQHGSITLVSKSPKLVGRSPARRPGYLRVPTTPLRQSSANT